MGSEFREVCHVFSCFSLGSLHVWKGSFHSGASVSSVGCPVAFSAVFEALRMKKDTTNQYKEVKASSVVVFISCI